MWWFRRKKQRYAMNYEYTLNPFGGAVFYSIKSGERRKSGLGSFKDERHGFYNRMCLPYPFSPYFELTFAHELGHVLTAHMYTVEETSLLYRGPRLMEFEVLAWSVAKSFIKPKLWNELHAIESLKTYEALLGEEAPTEIEEVNKGISMKSTEVICTRRG